MTNVEQTNGRGAAQLVRRDGLGNELAERNETASTAMAARAQAQIQSQYVMAMRNPRDWDAVRQKLLHRCESTTFAETARYARPLGKKKNEETGEWEQQYARGFSIRFAEEAIRCMTNMSQEVAAISDDARQRTIRCTVIDLESNTPWSHEITLEKVKERKSLKKGEVPIGQRLNSYGETVYLLPATADDVRQQEGSIVSKTVRTLALRALPGDLQDEARRVIDATLRAEVRKDPDAARKRLADAFAEFRVGVTDLSEYLGGRPLSSITEDEIDVFRGVLVCLRDGDRWSDLLAASPHLAVPAEPGADAENTPPTRTAAVAQKVAAKVESVRTKRRGANGAAKTAPKDVAPAPDPAPSQPVATADTEPPPAPAGREPGED